MMRPDRIVPPDPPEKWNTIGSALDDEDKARRLKGLMMVDNIPRTIALSFGVLVVIVILAILAVKYLT
jgi:hypothetical protein